MRILFVPDSLWGGASGHRSSKYLIKAFASANIEMGVYAPTADFTEGQYELLKHVNCKYYPRTEYSYKQQLFRYKIDQEFEQIISDFSPDYVFYVGTIKNKISIDYCIKKEIKYLYLPLTTEYYCINTFAGVETGPCFDCLKGSFTAPLSKKCLPPDYSMANFLKDKVIESFSRKRITSAYKVIGYSRDQLNVLECFGVDRAKTLKLPIFFDPNSAAGIRSEVGERFLIFGQFMTAKGWHLIPEIIRNTRRVKYKAIMPGDTADKFVKDNGLESQVESGALEIIGYLDTHKSLLEEVAKSRGVLIPSYYPTTGEFTMMEALMLRKPVVVFDSGIHREIFVDGKNGMIAKVGDLQGYCARVEALNSDKALYDTVASGAVELFADLTCLQTFQREIKSALMA
jgi:glycosyltransferase involved in cell wall biosynthesis